MTVSLYAICPLGIGTPEIEAMGSYLLRLGIEHGASAREVIAATASNVAIPAAKQVLVLNRGLTVLVRPDDQAALVLQQLQLALPEHSEILSRMTFHSLRRGLDKADSTFANTFKWCRHCFNEDLAEGRSAYYRLIWHLEAVDRCPKHRTKLYQACPSCGKRQDRRIRRAAMHRCVYCNRSLREQVGESIPHESWQNYDQDLVDLVGAIASGEFVSAKQDGVRSTLDQMFDEAWKTGHEREFWQLIPRDECLSVIECRQPVTFDMVRRYSQSLGVRLVDLFMGQTPRTAQLAAFGAVKSAMQRRRGLQ